MSPENVVMYCSVQFYSSFTIGPFGVTSVIYTCSLLYNYTENTLYSTIEVVINFISDCCCTRVMTCLLTTGH